MKNQGPESGLPKLYVQHFGCRLNQYETLSIENPDLDQKNGYRLTRRLDEADFVVINTCTVTNRADTKNRQAIRKAHRENPQAKIIVTGCYAVTDADELQNMEGVYRILKNDQKHGIGELVRNWQPNQAPEAPIAANLFPATHQRPQRLSRAYLKIQDGCNRRCSYCKIPQARGRAVSRPFAETLEEARRLVGAGFGEITLTGVNSGDYRSPEGDFSTLLRALTEIEGDFHIRLSSLEPDLVTDKLLEQMQNPKVARFLHIPIQSGSERILRQMRRSHATAEFKEIALKIRKHIPEMHIGTDLIVGFPGETEEDFQETLELCETMKFANTHIFPYSRRSGTRADDWINDKTLQPVHGTTIKERVHRLTEVADRNAHDYLAATAGKPFRAIVETVSPGQAKVVTENFIKCALEPMPDVVQKGQALWVIYHESGVARVAEARERF